MIEWIIREMHRHPVNDYLIRLVVAIRFNHWCGHSLILLLDLIDLLAQIVDEVAPRSYPLDQTAAPDVGLLYVIILEDADLEDRLISVQHDK